MTRPGGYKRVESLANPLVKELRGLHQKKFRDASGRFLAEGMQLVRFALDAGWKVRTLVYSGDADQAALDTAARAKADGALLVEATAPVLAKIARRDNPQSVIGVFDQRYVADKMVGSARGLWIALEEIRDPGNLGTIIRTADAAGATGIVLVGPCCDPFSTEAVRATMGSIFHVALATTDVGRLVAQVRQSGALLVGTHLSGPVDYRQAPRSDHTVLAMGSERHGLTPPLAEACDALVRIPMSGRAESLNLSVAAGLMIYRLRDPFL